MFLIDLAENDSTCFMAGFALANPKEPVVLCRFFV